MKKQNVVDMLNQLEVTDYNCENEVCYSIFVRNDNNTKELLWMLDVNEKDLDRTENSIDICLVAWRYAKRFDGKKFYID